ncbi:MAG TPA: hypothetical protein VGN39_09715, partial [Terriglobales bacterium]|nr:hypothetical protein [Terriglobales bacterium]
MASFDSNIAPASERFCLLGKSIDDLRELVVSLGEPPYRGAQIYHALYAERLRTIEEMSNLPMELRRRLDTLADLFLPQIARRHHSADGSVRYVLRLGNAARAEVATVEAVFMPEEKRQTICISTQAGCAVNCQFCLTATLGLLRN